MKTINVEIQRTYIFEIETENKTDSGHYSVVAAESDWGWEYQILDLVNDTTYDEADMDEYPFIEGLIEHVQDEIRKM